ncbi:hypothetical protein COCON_G00052930 [Conger conger]|uniref:Uncharacterized protein n=1 Tax=Conger conger TaxID=82655 RepID=A0A9Q1DW83_CONCO|nr:hypothetical protein COCON_G00052930 [Conger conger]
MWTRRGVITWLQVLLSDHDKAKRPQPQTNWTHRVDGHDWELCEMGSSLVPAVAEVCLVHTNQQCPEGCVASCFETTEVPSSTLSGKAFPPNSL